MVHSILGGQFLPERIALPPLQGRPAERSDAQRPNGHHVRRLLPVETPFQLPRQSCLPSHCRCQLSPLLGRHHCCSRSGGRSGQSSSKILQVLPNTIIAPLLRVTTGRFDCKFLIGMAAKNREAQLSPTKQIGGLKEEQRQRSKAGFSRLVSV